MSYGFDFFGQEYAPHGICLLWDPGVIWMHVVSDTLIALAYFSIPFLIYYFVYRRKDLQFTGMFHWFAAFIFLCGITHVYAAVNIWSPAYAAHGVFKVLTAVVSIFTAGLLAKLVPKALALPSPADLAREQANVMEERLKRVQLESQRDSNRWLDLAIQGSPTGILIMQPDGRVELANQTARGLLNQSTESPLFVSFFDLLGPQTSSVARNRILTFWESMDRPVSSMPPEEVFLQVSDDQEIPVELTLKRHAVGNDVRVFATISDLRERQAQEQDLRQTRRRFERVISGSMDAAWEWNPFSGECWSSSNIKELVDVPEGESWNLKGWQDTIHPTYRETFQERLDGHLKQDTPFNLEFQARGTDGSYQWFRMRGASLRNDQGDAILISGILSNIEESKRLSENLRWQQEALASLTSACSEGLMLIDKREPCGIGMINQPMADILDTDADALIGAPLSDLSASSSQGHHAQELVRLIQQIRHTGLNEQLTLADGQSRWWQISGAFWASQDHMDEFIVITANDITALKSSELELAQLLQDRMALFNEVHHRVKNNLQVITSLIDIRARTLPASEQEAFRELGHRVKAMSLIHQLLYQNESLTQVPLGEYLKKLADLVINTSTRPETRIKLEIIDHAMGAALELPRLVPTGLLATEVLTNSCKYGIRERRGIITIRTEWVDDQLMIELKDDGPGFDLATAEQSSSMGLTLIRGFARQAEFDLEIDLSKGARYLLRDRGIHR